MKLVIVGNGFDIHHNYKTSFNDFRKFLIDNKNNSLVNKIDSFTTEALNRKKGSKINEEELLWNQFEQLLTFYHPDITLVKLKNLDNQSDHLTIIDLLDEFTEEFANYIKKKYKRKI